MRKTVTRLFQKPDASAPEPPTAVKYEHVEVELAKRVLLVLRNQKFPTSDLLPLDAAIRYLSGLRDRSFSQNVGLHRCLLTEVMAVYKTLGPDRDELFVWLCSFTHHVENLDQFLSRRKNIWSCM